MRSGLVLVVALVSACLGTDIARSVEAPDDPVGRKRQRLLWLSHCLGNEGDPRGWPGREALKDRDWHLGPEYAYCTWRVEKGAQGIRAVSEDHRAVSSRASPPALPFRARWVPKYQVVYCRGDEAPHPERPAQTVSTLTELRDGFLVGFNAGEWGGGLYWYSRDGEVRQHIIDENVVHVAPFGTKFFVLTGIAHLTLDEGHATLLEFDGRRWHAVRSFDLGNEPGAVLSEANGTMLVATNERLLRLSENGRLEALHQSTAGWSYPSSLVRDADGTLYLGTRGPVVQLRARNVGYTETWLAPPGAMRPRQPDSDPLEPGS